MQQQLQLEGAAGARKRKCRNTANEGPTITQPQDPCVLSRGMALSVCISHDACAQGVGIT